jgi:branched-chain amino acid transport system ATP-binding protein
MNKILETRVLNVGYGDIQILWDIDLRIDEAEIVALAGSNGAGKTTLMRALIGLLKPISGEILLKSQPISNYESQDRVKMGISMVPEGREIFYAMTVEENLRMGAFTRTDPKGIEMDLAWIYELLPILKDRRSQYAGTLSGGEQQMCAIARALMAKPQLFLIDELSLGLAPVVVDKLTETISQIHQERKLSIFLVEQDVQIAFELAGRGYIIETGRIVVENSSEDILKDDKVREAYLGI